MAKALQNFKVDPVLKIDETFYKQAESVWYGLYEAIQGSGYITSYYISSYYIVSFYISPFYISSSYISSIYISSIYSSLIYISSSYVSSFYISPFYISTGYFSSIYISSSYILSSLNIINYYSSSTDTFQPIAFKGKLLQTHINWVNFAIWFHYSFLLPPLQFKFL